jgi:UDP-glucose 6-dehydrogenase
MRLLDAVIRINQYRPLRMLDLLTRHYDSLLSLPVTVLGLAFKEDTDDVRESPGVAVAGALAERGARVTVYDPVASRNARAQLGETVSYADSLGAAVAGAETILVCTRWSEFRGLAPLVRAQSPPPLVIDGRRMLEPADFPRYDGIGL